MSHGGRILPLLGLCLLLAACSAATAPIAGGPTPAATSRPPPTIVPSPVPTDLPTVVPTAPAHQPPAPTPTPTPPMPSPPSGSARVVSRGDPSRPLVALTFDAGADAGHTVQVLDTLRAKGVRASFGITGRWAEQNPELLRRIVAEGHHLINHSYSHDSFTGRSTGRPPLSQTQRWQELDRTEEIVQRLTGATTKPYFRPPYGDYDASVNADIYARGYLYNVMWTVDSQGWTGLPAQQIVQRCLSLAQPGAIYVFHVGSASQDALALPAIIDGLRAAGYGLVTVPQLMAP
ncbi:MAG TPA: polysaccharide deacetylase family protein [Dehalococcoidia bacterium]|nr:polysaccharide deacetylase family protein [Dehalococcoidia bacterium]